MNKKVLVPAFVFKPVMSEKTTVETIRRKDDVLEIEFPTFQKADVLKIAETLSLRKRRAHDRPIDETIEIMNQVGDLWTNPNYDLRKEAIEILPMTSGQSRSLCELELTQTVGMWNRKVIEIMLAEMLKGKNYLDSWIPTGMIKLHAQPRGVILHNLAGNAFNLGPGSIAQGLMTKNVNLVKLPHEEPYFTVKFAESISEVDKKIAKEIAVLYWSGSQADIYDELFRSGNIDCVMAWGGLTSIEETKRRAYRFGLKVIDHGPKTSFSIISEEMLLDPEMMQKVAKKIAMDVAIYNQKACLSPRVIYIKEKSSPIAISKPSTDLKEKEMLNSMFSSRSENNFTSLMQRSLKLLRNEVTDSSPLGFAKVLANAMKEADISYPRANLTEADGLETARKREYFSMKYEIKEEATLIIPKKDNMNWTVIYLRHPPTLSEIDMCQDRFVIVTRIASIEELVHFFRKEKMQQYLQTFSIYGTDDFVEEFSEELSLLGAFRFPRVGEHNLPKIGAPWDGRFDLEELIRWVDIEFLTQKGEEERDVKNLLWSSESR